MKRRSPKSPTVDKKNLSPHHTNERKPFFNPGIVQKKKAPFFNPVNNASSVSSIHKKSKEENGQRKKKASQKAVNNTGLPDKLKMGIENLSGISLDDVNVYRNSDKPAQIQAHAFAQGTDIHLAPGQEKHLAHEAWHVIQQKQGRVKQTGIAGNKAINNDKKLEQEADEMGKNATNKTTDQAIPATHKRSGTSQQSIVQAVWNPPGQGPNPFNPMAALMNAYDTTPTYVQIHRAASNNARRNFTIAVYTYINVAGWRICVVQHAHINGNPSVARNWIAGNCYIPGWQGWQTRTPPDVVNHIRAQWAASFLPHFNKNRPLRGHGNQLVLHGAFPGAGRYPQNLIPPAPPLPAVGGVAPGAAAPAVTATALTNQRLRMGFPAI